MSDDPNNATIQSLRSHIATLEGKVGEATTGSVALQQQLDAVTEQLKVAERAKLDETERLRLELEDHKTKLTALTTVQQEATELAATVNANIESRINAVPEAHRQTLKDLLTPLNSPAAKLAQLDKLIALGNFGDGTPPGGPIAPGNPPPVPSPSTTTTQAQSSTVQYDPKNLPGWGELMAPKPNV